MRYLTRILLIRLLLLAVFFHTAIGVPLHAFEHLREALAPLVSAQQDAEEPAEHGEAHAACAWCASYAQQAQALGTNPKPWQPPAAQADRHAPGYAAGAPRSADRWPFRARDPPQA